MGALIVTLIAVSVAAIGLAIWGSSERQRRVGAEAEAESLARNDRSNRNSDFLDVIAEDTARREVIELKRQKQHALNVLNEYREFVKVFHADHVPHVDDPWDDGIVLQPDALVKDAVMGLALIDDAQDDSRLIRLVNDLRGTPKEQ